MQQYSQGFIQSSPTPLLACTCCPSLHLHVLCAGQGGIAAPGSIAATPVEAPVDVEEGLPVEVPLVYFYGHVSPADNPELYKFLVERLAALLDKRAEVHPASYPGAMHLHAHLHLSALRIVILNMGAAART